MYHAESLKSKITLFLSILWPILITQVSLLAMNIVDTMMSGRVGTNDLAGVAIGSSLWVPVLTGINGILMAVTPIVAQYMGSGQRDQITYSVMQALYLAVVLSAVVVLFGFFVLEPILLFMGLDPAVQHIAFHYLIGLALGIIPLFLSNVLRNFFDGQGFTRITMFIIIMAVPFNVLLNYGFIFGNFGLPALGGIGAGYATAATYWIILLFSVFMTFRLTVIRRFGIFVNWFRPSWRAWKEQLSIGIPIGLSIFFETSIFSVVTLLMGTMFTTVTVAANQVALSFASLVFMLPLSISMALTILVGYSVGGKRLQAAKQYTTIGLLGGICILAISSVFIYFFRESIAALYTHDPVVILLAGQLLLIVIIFQLSDATQAGLQGALRGYKDVRIPFIIAFISYWIIGIPSGYLLAAFTGLGPYGLWIGITLGLTCAAIGFLIRLRIVQKRAEQTLTADLE
jgi:MATE family multidrug resistance protein